MNNTDVKPSVTAIIDLSGFSSHLEIGDYDLRTEIGNSASNRLQVLEDALEILYKENYLSKKLYPKKFKSLRFNDSIYFTMDLDDSLIPSIGKLVKDDISGEEMDTILKNEYSDDQEKDLNRIRNHYAKLVHPLCKFVGFVARIHYYIYLKEKESHFPGVKTVIAFGLRKRFINKFNKKEDFFSANFSTSTAYLASKELRGTYFFIDNNVLQMLCYNTFAKNLIQYSQYIKEAVPFYPEKEYPEITLIPTEYKKTDIKQIEIFRKKMIFRSIDFRPLGYLQVIESLKQYLKGKKKSNSKNSLSAIILNGIQQKFSFTEKESKMNRTYLVAIKNDIETNLNDFIEDIIVGSKKIKSYIPEYIFKSNK